MKISVLKRQAAALALGEARAKLALAVALIFVTAPVAAHLVARAAYSATGRAAHVDADDELRATIDDAGGRTP